MTIVVAGGTGFLGSALVAAWRAEGHQVLVLTRRPRHADEIPWMPGNGSSSVSVIDGAQAVVNLAGESIAGARWTAARKRAILDSRTAATRALAAAIRSARTPPAVFLSASGVGIYGTGGAIATESTPPGTDFLAEVCRAWEAAASEAAAHCRVVLLRTGVVLDRTHGALPQMALPFRFFAGGPVGSGRQYISWIHREDWVALARWALLAESASGPLNLTAPQPVTNAEFSRALGRAMRRPALLRVPGFALRLALGEMADALLLEGQRVLPEKAQRLGFTFRYETLDAALRAIYGS
jgi:uncharacterized protein (TIGR01777 family)